MVDLSALLCRAQFSFELLEGVLDGMRVGAEESDPFPVGDVHDDASGRGVGPERWFGGSCPVAVAVSDGDVEPAGVDAAGFQPPGGSFGVGDAAAGLCTD